MEGKEKRIPCDVYSRIVGYMMPLRGWNKGKKAEFYDRHVKSQDEIAASLKTKEAQGEQPI